MGVPDRRALVFGTAAEAYERFRPGYPADVVDAVFDFTASPVRTALEIGAGTGKATRLFAARGIEVTAIEPDAGMIEQLLDHVPPSTTVECSTFEDFVPTRTYDLVYAAAALHWTRPQGRWERIAGLLEPGGTFASLGGPPRLDDPELEQAVARARSPWLEHDDIVPSSEAASEDESLRWPGAELSASPLFGDVRHSTIERRLMMRGDDFVGMLSTVSAYLVLPVGARTHALAAVRSVLPAQVEVIADVELDLARRA